MSTDPAPSLAARQAELVAALTVGGPVPDGMDARRVAATARALLRKRAAVAARAWPRAAAAFGPSWSDQVVAVLAGTAPGGPLADGRAVLLALDARGALPAQAAAELAARQAAPRIRWSRRLRDRWRRG